MRTIFPILFILALGTGALIWSMSGVGAIYGQGDPVSGVEAGDSLIDAKNDSAVSDGGSFNGSAEGETSGGGIVGIIVSGVGFITDFASLVGLLPFELMKLGFPAYFALPVGILAQALVGVGIVEFATNRELT